MILVTGAGGKTGYAVVQALAARGASIRALVRRHEQVTALHQRGATEAVIGDMRSPDDIQRACAGADAVYHICPNMQPDEVTIAAIALAAARATDVGRFVYHSVLHPQTEEMPHHWHKLRVEEMLFKSGLDYTILQPAAYMQNVLASWSSIVNEGVYRAPYAVETRLGLVDLVDVAEAAALVLTQKGHNGATYELCGGAVLSQTQTAAILSACLGRPVHVEPMDRREWARRAQKTGLSNYAVATLRQMFVYYEQYGFWGNPQVLTWLLGRPPTRFETFVRRTAGRHGSPSTGEDA